jgi:CRP-like cAMP-binding protein
MEMHVPDRSFPKGTLLFAKGDAAHAAYLVKEGEVEIFERGHDGRRVVFNTMRAGDLFGEMGVLGGETRSADAYCVTDYVLTVIDRGYFDIKLRNYDKATLRILAFLMERVRTLSERVRDLESPKRHDRTDKDHGGN